MNIDCQDTKFARMAPKHPSMGEKQGNQGEYVQMIISQYDIESAFSRELCVSWRGLIIDECFMCVAIVCDVLLFIIGSKCRYLCIVCIFDYSQSLIQGKGACCKYRKISSDIDCILMRDPLDGIWLGWTHWRVVGDKFLWV